MPLSVARCTLAGALAVAFLAPAAARAQLEVGARLGYAVARGDLAGAGNLPAAVPLKMSDGVKSQVPLQLDVGYRVWRDLAVGAYLSYGFAQLASSACPSGADCTARDLRVGVQATYAFRSLDWPLVPWLGVGAGWERGSYEATLFGFKGTASFTGWELLNVQLGADRRVSERLSVGPWVGMSFGTFDHVKVTTPDPSLNADQEIPSKSGHQWLAFGVRALLGF